MLRRAMGKKSRRRWPNSVPFLKRARKNGIDGELAMKIFDPVEKFAGFGLTNRTRRLCAGFLPTLWLKAHHPADFMAAVMTADMDNTGEGRRPCGTSAGDGPKILPPDINLIVPFHVNDEGDRLRYGAIKGVGEGPIEAIIDASVTGAAISANCRSRARTDTVPNRRVLKS